MGRAKRLNKQLKEPNQSMTTLLRLLKDSPRLSKRRLADILGYRSATSIARKCKVLERLGMLEQGDFKGRIPKIRVVTERGVLWLEEHQ